MKIGKLLLVGAIALGMVACNNDEVPNANNTGEKATVSIKITKATTGTRATDALATVAERTVQESAIKKLDVFVFNGDAVDGYGTATGTNVLEVLNIAVTTGSRTLVVVANATADMGTITSKTALLDKVASDLSAQTLDNGLLMTSPGDLAAFTIAAGKNYYGYTAGQTPAGTEHSVGVPVKLTRVPARVALVGATAVFEGSYAGFTFEPEQVFLFNAKKQSKYFGSSLVQGDELLSGIDLASFNGPLKPDPWNAAWTANYLQDLTDLTDVSTDKPVYYYTFENDPSVQPTVLSIKGKIKKADGTPATATEFPGAIADDQGTTYYSIIVNATRGGYTYTGTDVEHDGTIIRNTQYNISVTIKHLGKDDPTEPPTEAAMLDVKVEVVPWVVVNQAVEY